MGSSSHGPRVGCYSPKGLQGVHIFLQDTVPIILTFIQIKLIFNPRRPHRP